MRREEEEEEARQRKRRGEERRGLEGEGRKTENERELSASDSLKET